MQHDEDTATFTYARLLATARAAALGLLLVAGFEPGTTTVVSFCDEAPASVVAFLATGFANAVVVPVDPGAPEHRLRALVEDCGARRYLDYEDIDADPLSLLLSVLLPVGRA